MLLGAGSYLFRYSVGTTQFKLEKPLSAIDLVEKAADLGFDLVQFADNLPLDPLDNSTLDELRETASRREVVLEVGTAGAQTERLLRYLDIAKRLEAKLVRLTIHADDVQPTKDEALKTLKEVIPHYREAGVIIAIENHFTMQSIDLVSLVTEINDPYVGICLDTANSIVQQEWPMETVKLLGEHHVSLHLKDYKMKAHPDGVGVMIEGSPLGEGDQDIDSIMNYVYSSGKDVNVILEQWLPPAASMEETLRNEEEWILRSVKNARKWIRRI
jgi:sugar phosphate isomerase/epimerase